MDCFLTTDHSVYRRRENGFIQNVLLIFKSETKTGDYHEKMNSGNLMR
jgi:hypothetical protein